VKRRKFILLSLIGTVGVSLPACQASPASRVRPRELAAICDEETLGEIGNAYLQQAKNEKDIDRLSALIMRDASGRPADAVLNVEDLDRRLAQHIADDFRAGNTAVVKGWVLSLTEARLCALLTLSS